MSEKLNSDLAPDLRKAVEMHNAEHVCCDASDDPAGLFPIHFNDAYLLAWTQDGHDSLHEGNVRLR
jgi:hypothetical protein